MSDITITATVSRTVFPREEFNDGHNHFCVIATDRGKCKGQLPFYPQPGMVLRLTGNPIVYHGERQFAFVRVEQEVPQDQRTLLEYVCKLGKGLGPKTAEKIFAKWGDEWQRHIEELSPSVSIAVRQTLDVLNANQAKLDLTLFCIRIGGSPSIADKAWMAWRDNAHATIVSNPYLLASIQGIGFKTADAIAEKLGIGKKDLRRAFAAIDFAVTSLMENCGDSIVSRDSVYKLLNEMGVPREVAMPALAKLVAEGRIVFVGLDQLTTSHVVEYEGDLARYAVEYTREDIKRDVEWDEGFKPDDSQEEAAKAAVCHRGLTVINGGGGCGKTTIIRAITNTIPGTVCLCAFAGKAAARLREATGHPASTIHSLLGYTGEGRGFSLDTLEGCTVIVDEASMVPSSLLHEITSRNPARLILVGDQAQLQPVGIGAPFHDIVDNLPTVVHTLQVCHRNKEAVFSSANKIRNGEIPGDAKSSHEKFTVERVPTPEAAHHRIVELVRSGTIDFAQDLVLAPRNGEGEEPAPCTVKSLNSDVQAIVNPHSDSQKFRTGDRVMCVKNFPRADLWNGTCGFISRVDGDGIPFFASDEGGDVRLAAKEQRESIVPAYALTVHKSQGSQYRNVYVLALKRDTAILFDRSMLYTAVTRARCNCHILCDNGIDRIVNTMHRRRTYLQLFLKGRV